ncbi:ParA family protein [Leptospira sp. id769339]|uniref:ParA family protein n=1 Tax=Leptospira sp. id769339 TaxID=2864221 RepID=UPI00214BC434|nr:ParA family protein [Leptospira sp. id769339]
MKKPKVISIAGNKGGIGKTTIAIYLGQALRFLGFKVLVIDMDHNNNLTNFMLIHFDINPEEVEQKNTLKAMKEESSYKDNIFITKTGLDFMPAKKDVKKIDLEFFDDPGIRDRFSEELHNLEYDFIIIDLHPMINLGMICAIQASDQILCPMETGTWSNFGVNDIIDERDKIEKLLRKKISLSVVISKVTEAKSKELREILAKMEKKRNFKVNKSAILRDDVYIVNNSIGEFLNEKRGNAFKQFLDLAKEVAG